MITSSRRRRGLLAIVLTILAALVVAQSAISPATADNGPSNGRIAFARCCDENQLTFHSIEPDGSGEAPLSETADTTWWSSSIVPSPDATKIAYASESAESYRIFIANADGSDAQELPNSPAGNANRPAWSPDGTHLTFTVAPSGDTLLARIYTASVDGAEVQPLGPDEHSLADPTYSPDGARIVFADHTNSDSQGIYSMTTSGDDVVRLTADDDSHPKWLAVGEEIPGSTTTTEPTTTTTTDAPTTTTTLGPTTTTLAPTTTTTSTTVPPTTTTTVAPTTTTTSTTVPPTTTTTLAPTTTTTTAPKPNLAPKAAALLAIPVPRTLLVDGKWSSDPDGTIVKYEWRWGDGGAFGTTRRAWHVYARSGWYMLRLTVTDNRGATNTRAAWIYIPDAR